MQICNVKENEEIRIEKFPYKGRMHDVKGISVRWLSKHGEDDSGQPEYGLRFFTAQPGGEIPTHNHFYVQTMYILSGRFECWSLDSGSGEIAAKRACVPGDIIYVPSMEAHGMRNLSQTEPATFLCCICNVYEEENL